MARDSRGLIVGKSLVAHRGPLSELAGWGHSPVLRRRFVVSQLE